MLSCKDTNFKANHNLDSLPAGLVYGVCYLAKIRILKQITTGWYLYANCWRCLLSCKDTNFKANHNDLDSWLWRSIGVCYLAKIRILKQITTVPSNERPFRWCLLSCKDTNFKANHNQPLRQKPLTEGVCYLAKIRILKQITTNNFFSQMGKLVFVILQRYEF